MEIPKLGQSLDKEHLQFLKAFSTNCRRTTIEMLKQSQSGHPGGSLSCMDFLTLLYTFIISQKGEKVVISNGHISPGLYSVFAELGYVNKDEVIKTFRQVGSIFEGHVTRHVPGIWYGTGPLGIGIAAATGFALGEKLRSSKQNVYCLLGDGECQEGEVYEALHFANKYQLNNLTVFVDYNAIQLSGPLQEIMPIDPPAIFRSSHWNVIEVNGHDYKELWTALHGARLEPHAPTVIIGKTIMGKGVSFMEKDSLENTYNWHGVAPSPEQADKALQELMVTPEDQTVLKEFREKQIRWKPEEPFKIEQAPPNINVGKQKILAVSEKTDCRSAYGNALKDIADMNPDLLALTADLGGSVKTDVMKKAYPNRVLDSGVAEQHMVSCSGALSLMGFVPFCSTFGAFMTSRAKDQARVNDINRTNVKMVSTHCGLSVGEDGPTHQAIDDMGSLLGFFNTTILEPSDPNHCDHMIRYASKTYGNFYIRMGRAKLPIIAKTDGMPFFDEHYGFEPGKGDLIREGSQLTILAAGPMVTMAMKVMKTLKDKASIELICLSSLSHLSEELILASATKTKKVLTLEDHNLYNGYAARVAALIAHKGLSVRIESMGVRAYQLSGKSEELYDEAGLGLQDIEKKVLSML